MPTAQVCVVWCVVHVCGMCGAPVRNTGDVQWQGAEYVERRNSAVQQGEQERWNSQCVCVDGVL